MNGVFVVVLTAIPILYGTWVGYRRGGSSALVSLSKTLLSWFLGVGLATIGLQQGWHWPVGLVSPILYGLLLAIAVRWVFIWRKWKNKKRSEARQLSKLQHSSGALLGAVLGLVCAVAGWQVALFFDCIAKPLPTVKKTPLFARSVPPVLSPEPKQAPGLPSDKPPQSSWSALVQVAQQGFIKHLPIAGPLSEDVLAVASVMKTSPEVRREFARHKGWDSLVELSSLKAIAKDKDLFADIDAAISGNLLALYRLQKHPLMIKFAHEEPLQKIIAEMQAGQVAAELEDFRTRKPVQAFIPDDFHF